MHALYQQSIKNLFQQLNKAFKNSTLHQQYFLLEHFFKSMKKIYKYLDRTNFTQLIQINVIGKP